MQFGRLPVLTSAHADPGTLLIVPPEVAAELERLQSGLDALRVAIKGEEPVDLATAERLHIERVVELAGGNLSKAARILKVSRSTLKRKGF